MFNIKIEIYSEHPRCSANVIDNGNSVLLYNGHTTQVEKGEFLVLNTSTKFKTPKGIMMYIRPLEDNTEYFAYTNPSRQNTVAILSMKDCIISDCETLAIARPVLTKEASLWTKIKFALFKTKYYFCT